MNIGWGRPVLYMTGRNSKLQRVFLSYVCVKAQNEGKKVVCHRSAVVDHYVTIEDMDTWAG